MSDTTKLEKYNSDCVIPAKLFVKVHLGQHKISTCLVFGCPYQEKILANTL